MQLRFFLLSVGILGEMALTVCLPVCLDDTYHLQVYHLPPDYSSSFEG